MRRTIAMLAAAGVLVAGGCGGGDDDSDGASNTDTNGDSGNSTSTSRSGNTGSGDSGSGDSGSGDSGSGDTGSSGDSGGSGSGNGNGSSTVLCDQAEALYESSADAEPSQETFTVIRVTMEDIDPPPELAEDWQASIDALNDLLALGNFGELDPGDPEVAAALDTMDTAGANIDAYLRQECGIDISP